MIWTGQESVASFTLSIRSAGALPSAGLSPIRYFAVIWLQLSTPFCSKNSGQTVQHDSQLMHSSLVIVTLVFDMSSPLKIEFRSGYPRVKSRNSGARIYFVDRDRGAFCSNTSSTHERAADTLGNPIVLVRRIMAWRISSGLAPADIARRAWE